MGELAKMFDENKFFGHMHSELCTLLMDISELGLKDQQASGVLPRFYMKYLEAVWFILFLPGKRDGISGCSPDIDRDADEVSSVGKEVADDEEEDRRMFDKAQQMTTKETELAQQSDLKPAATSGQSALKASSQRHHQSHEEERPTKSAKLGSVHDGEEGQRMSQFDKARMITKETEVAQQFDLKLTREIPRGATAATHIVQITKRLCGWDAGMLEGTLELVQLMEAIQTVPLEHLAFEAMVRDALSSIRCR